MVPFSLEFSLDRSICTYKRGQLNVEPNDLPRPILILRTLMNMNQRVETSVCRVATPTGRGLVPNVKRSDN